MDREVLRSGALKGSRGVYALVRDMGTAMQIVKNAEALHLSARNFDKAQTLIECLKAEKSFLVILDFEKCEAESFQALNELRQNADLKSIPVVGFVTQTKAPVKSEAEKAGCLRVYMKTEFVKGLSGLIARYAV